MVSTFILLTGMAALGWVRVHTIAAYFQQEEYDYKRFLQAWPSLSLIDFKFTIATILLGMLGVLATAAPLIPAGIGGAALAIALLEWRALAAMKKPFVRTRRARRLMFLTAGIWGVIATALVFSLSVLGAIVAMQSFPLVMVLANAILAPVQQSENQRYIHLAKDKIARFNGETIGITGSFGKTTVKHILGDSLGQLSSVYFSAGSVNTVLGHTRHIRQRLQPSHRYFIAEMGAYGEGSIQRLCELADPDHAIITSIGLAHNERFKGLDVVARAKSELAQWVANKGAGGKIVMTQDVASYAPFANIIASNQADCVVVGVDPYQYHLRHL